MSVVGFLGRLSKFCDSRLQLPQYNDVFFAVMRLRCVYKSGQIIATSHDLTPNGGLVSEIPLFQGNLCW